MAVLSLVQANCAGNPDPAIKLQVVESKPKLKKDGTPKKICQNKQKGKKSEVYHLEIEDMKKITAYFRDNEKWLTGITFPSSVKICDMPIFLPSIAFFIVIYLLLRPYSLILISTPAGSSIFIKESTVFADGL